MSYTKIHYTVADGVAVIELSDPPANTYSYEMMRELDAAVLAARMDAAVHVLVIRGAGDKFFCAGADIRMLTDADPEWKYYFCLHANETLLRLEHTPKLVIAALNGHTVGGGLEVALAADIRIARKDAGRIGLPEVSLGVLPGTGGTQRLTRLVGKARAIELMVSGRLLSFEEAHQLGIVNAVWDEPDFPAAVLVMRRSSRHPQKRVVRWGDSSALHSRAAKAASWKGCRSSANSSSCSSRATMPAKGSRPMSRSERRCSRESSELSTCRPRRWKPGNF